MYLYQPREYARLHRSPFNGLPCEHHGEGVLGVLDRVNGSTNCFIRTLSCVELSLDNVGMSLVLEEMIRGIM